MFITETFEVLTDTIPSRRWNADLAQLFEFGRQLTCSLNAEIQAGRLPQRSCVKSVLASIHSSDQASMTGLQSLRQDYPIELQAPFEGVASISGAVWKGSELYGSNRDDAMLKLRFDAGTRDLPMHSHEDADRVIVVVDGAGVFYVSLEAVEEFSGADIRSVSVRVGDVLAFSRGVVHTFNTDSSALVLLSYHSPFIPLDDPRQYTLPAQKCCHGCNVP